MSPTQLSRWLAVAATCLFASALGGVEVSSGGAAAGRELVLTAEQRAWLRAHPVIRVGCDPDFKPFSFREAEGRVSGVDVDLLGLLERKLGVKFEWTTEATWSAVYARAVKREIDVLSGTADVPERREHFRFTREYVRFPVTIVARGDGPFAVMASDLREMKVAAPRDYAATLVFQRTFPAVAIDLTNSIEDALERVARKKADVAVTNLATASYIIKTRGFANLKMAGVLPDYFALRLAVREDQAELHGILEAALAAVTADEMAAILDRWVRVDYAAVIRWDVVRRWAIIGLVFALTVIGLVMWRNRTLGRELVKRRELLEALEVANAGLNEANVQLRLRHEEKTELMRMAAHDLRSPLTAIVLSAEVMQLQRKGDDAELNHVSAAAGQMKALIDDLLDVHGLEEGQRKFTLEPLDAMTELRASLTALDPIARRKGITVECVAAEMLPPVRADAGALRQVFGNLVSNAIKFSPPGRRVTVSAAVWNGYVRVEVRDEGPGVPAAERERIFTKYARGTAKPTAGEKSTGLGLTIVRDIVSIMNGRVWCESGEGVEGGATFVVALPLADGAETKGGRAGG